MLLPAALERRATATGPVAEGYPDCSDVGNDELTCFPTNTTVVLQNEWSKLIWNFNYPLFIASSDEIDAHLFLASSDTLIQSWTSLPNPEGQLAFSPNDTWWQGQYGADGLPNSTSTKSWQAYFIIVAAGQELSGTETHQPTFIARQTAIPTSASLSLASISSTASIASVASASSASISTDSVASRSSLSVKSTATSSATTNTLALASMSSASIRSVSTISLLSLMSTNPSASASIVAHGGVDGSLQGGSGGLALPKWAIALVSVLGALLLFILLSLAYLFLRRVRMRTPILAGLALGSNRKQRSAGDLSVDSGAPVMREARPDSANGRAGGTFGNGFVAGALPGSGYRPAEEEDGLLSPLSSIVTHGDSSLQSQAAPVPYQSSPRRQASFPTSPLSPEDALTISQAYRQALSQPTFFHDGEGETPPTDDETPGKGADEVLRRELAKEGTLLRNVPVAEQRVVHE